MFLGTTLLSYGYAQADPLTETSGDQEHSLSPIERAQREVNAGNFSSAEDILKNQVEQTQDLKKADFMGLYSLVLAQQSKWEELFDEIDSSRNTAEIIHNTNTQKAFALTYDAAILLAREEQFNEALDLLQKLKEYTYNTNKLEVDLVVIKVWRGHYEQALAAYRLLSEDQQNIGYLKDSIVFALEQLKRPDDLLKFYADQLLDDPENQTIRQRAYALAKEMGELELAEYHLSWLTPQETDIQYYREKLLLQLNQNEFLSALKTAQSMPSDYNEDIDVIFRPYLTNLPYTFVRDQYNNIIRSAYENGLSQAAAMVFLEGLQKMSTTPGSRSSIRQYFSPRFDQYSDDLKGDIADFYLQHHDLAIAKNYYDRMTHTNPTTKRGVMGHINIHIHQKEFLQGIVLANEYLTRSPEDIDVLFLKGQIYDETKDFMRALKTYRQILLIDEDNQAAKNLKSRVLMDLGANSLVIQEAETVDPVIVKRAKGSDVTNYLTWEEADIALDKLGQIEEMTYQDFQNDGVSHHIVDNYFRSQWDKMIALRQENRMNEMLLMYEDFLQMGIDIPSWIHQTSADGYLYEQYPVRALVIYEDLLRENPKSRQLRMAKYYTLVELGRFKDAAELLMLLDYETPVRKLTRGIYDDNWEKAEIAYDKAWLLMYQDRLAEAYQTIQEMHHKAPNNTNIRNIKAHNFLWRGWPRKSLEEFRLIRSMDPDLVPAHIGYAYALNENMRKEEARDEIAALLKEFPANKHILLAQRAFDVEEMSQLRIDVSYTQEFPGEDELYLSARLDHPLNFHHNLFAEIIRRETTQFGGNDVTRKIYVGDEWQINNTLQLVGAVSADYEQADEDLGYLARATVTPNDHWRFDLQYEKDILSIPLRSRSTGVTADEYQFSTTYRASERFNTSLGTAFKDFSDSNENWYYFWRTDTALYTRAYWKMRLYTEYDYSTFDRQDVDYFSPEHLSSFYLIPMLEHTMHRQYEKNYVHRLYIGIGQQWQKNYGGENVGFIRYEHDYRFSDTRNWLIGVRYDLDNYDGADANALNFYSTIIQKF
ncbi:MAG: hypothetical protein KC713_00295 [Candidatus Omnitrophica bacterium]|nr:hypothetical protein [Candidatus Omnitrophota bacterium]